MSVRAVVGGNMFVLAAAFWLAACSSSDGGAPGSAGSSSAGSAGSSSAGSSSAGSAGTAGSGGAKGGTPSVPGLMPPATVDFDTCAHSAGGGDAVSYLDCRKCCSAAGAGHSTAGFFQGKCVCGVEASAPACTPLPQIQCQMCCQGAGFVGGAFSGGGSAGNDCVCEGKSDGAICAAAIDDPNPAQACPVCCLNNGYVNDSYSVGDTSECECRDNG